VRSGLPEPEAASLGGDAATTRAPNLLAEVAFTLGSDGLGALVHRRRAGPRGPDREPRGLSDGDDAGMNLLAYIRAATRERYGAAGRELAGPVVARG
jgi:hypothetical protein